MESRNDAVLESIGIVLMVIGGYMIYSGIKGLVKSHIKNKDIKKEA